MTVGEGKKQERKEGVERMTRGEKERGGERTEENDVRRKDKPIKSNVRPRSKHRGHRNKRAQIREAGSSSLLTGTNSLK